MPRIVRVAVPVPLLRLFDYRLPSDMAAPAPGCRVRVPFGRRQLTGIVVELADDSTIAVEKLQDVSALLDDQPLLTAELMQTLTWAARYYQHAMGEVCAAALPVGLRSGRELPENGVPAIEITPEGRDGRQQPGRRRGTKIDTLLGLLADAAQSTAVLDLELPGWRSSARSLRERGWIAELRLAKQPVPRAPVPAPDLNEEQQHAVDGISGGAHQFAPFLLDGVTGSGKTEVYLAAIMETVRRGQQALVLVPEIALTPQTTRRFRERLGADIAILHSGLSEGERSQAWLDAARGDAKVILGTRSAIFVPLPNPGLIVVDEEHDTSYKQQDGFRYHARDLAVVRARALGIPVVLGSATPSLESLANVEAGRYRQLLLTKRAGAARPPSLKIMDVRNKRLEHGLAISTLDAIAECVARDEQVLVFRNRRGYAPVLYCRSCGWSAQCARCDRPLTVHRGAARLRCHHCGAESRIPPACPECAGIALAPQGQGTERIEEVLKEKFPEVPILRVDRDSTKSRSGRDAVFEQLNVEGPRILVGTQMLAKGHDLPNLTLVVVTGVDEGLRSVDFRASERLGQLIVQVAGRAGRAERPGSVILQTHYPDHPLLLALVQGGYPELVKNLLSERRAAGLPPFAQLALLRAEAKSLNEANAFLSEAVALGKSAGRSIALHGPLPAPMPRRAGFQRSQVLIESETRSAMQTFLPDWLEPIRALPSARRVRWSIDVDPVEMG